jgi:hypothetical protein
MNRTPTFLILTETLPGKFTYWIMDFDCRGKIDRFDCRDIIHGLLFSLKHFR